jgi:hypothetical protein
VAEWPWNQWPDRRGTGGRISVESVAECPWNGWPNGRGIRTIDAAAQIVGDALDGLVQLGAFGFFAVVRHAGLLPVDCVLLLVMAAGSVVRLSTLSSQKW